MMFSINCGLLALGNVISALGDEARKASHVPYRLDSALITTPTILISSFIPASSAFFKDIFPLFCFLFLFVQNRQGFQMCVKCRNNERECARPPSAACYSSQLKTYHPQHFVICTFFLVICFFFLFHLTERQEYTNVA